MMSGRPSSFTTTSMAAGAELNVDRMSGVTVMWPKGRFRREMELQ